VSRIAFFSPLPPSPTGIADYSADLLQALSTSFSIDAFHGQDRVDPSRLDSRVGVFGAEEFGARHGRAPYDLAVYQLGNSPVHAFMEGPLERVPGLLVLHDLVLHHSRAQRFLASPEVVAYARDPSQKALRDAAQPVLERYREELVSAYPEQGERIFEVHLASVGTLLPYAYPLFQVPVRRSRMTLVHNGSMARAVAEGVPGAIVRQVPMPVSPLPVREGEAAALRQGLGIGAHEFVVGCFGLLTPEKQLHTAALSLARASHGVPGIRWLLIGEAPEPRALETLLQETGTASRTIRAGRVPQAQLAAHLEACDVVMHLRYPTARETSAALLRVLAQGRPTIMTDLENLAEVPRDAVVRTDPTDEEGDATRALLRLAGRGDLRRSLGTRAAAFIREAHSPERAREAYAEAIAEAIARPAPPPA
jgi:glycosyltransferase involved in cell wall biosynthesis